MKTLVRGRRLLLDLVPAIMLGAAVGFLAWLAPLELIERLVVRSHLALVVPQARPPIGTTGRALIAGAAAAGATLLAFASALAIGVVERRRPRRSVVAAHSVDGSAFEGPAAMPLLRRADRHPDAPPKRPLLAQNELGGSFDMLSTPDTAPPASDLAPVAPSVRPQTAPQGSVAELLARLERGAATMPQAERRAAHG